MRCYPLEMSIRLLFTAFSLLLTAAVFAQAYRWVDEDGVVHYSDRPHEGAEEIQLLESAAQAERRRQRAQSASRATANVVDEPAAELEEPFHYDSIEVVAPAPEETLWNIAGVLDVAIDIRPSLRDGHTVKVYFDGEPRTVTRANFQIEDVYRGVHNIQVEVLDESGEMMGRSLPNRFYVQQTTIAR